MQECYAEKIELLESMVETSNAKVAELEDAAE